MLTDENFFSNHLDSLQIVSINIKIKLQPDRVAYLYGTTSRSKGFRWEFSR